MDLFTFLSGITYATTYCIIVHLNGEFEVTNCKYFYDLEFISQSLNLLSACSVYAV